VNQYVKISGVVFVLKNSKAEKNSKLSVLTLTNSGVLVERGNDYNYYAGSYSPCSKCLLRGLCGIKQ